MNDDKETLVLSLMVSKGWLRSYATAFVEDVLEREQRPSHERPSHEHPSHEHPSHERAFTDQHHKYKFDRYQYIKK